MMNNMNSILRNMNDQIGMNNHLMTNFVMDDVAQRIKTYIEPYEKRIIELEKIIRQKDFEIILLKEKINKYEKSIMTNNNMNMGMNMNMNNNMNNGIGMNNNMNIGMNINNNINNNMNMGMNNNMNLGANINNNIFNNNMNIGVMNMNLPFNMDNNWMSNYDGMNNIVNKNSESDVITLTFAFSNSEIISIPCSYESRISEVIDKFALKAGINSNDLKNLKFIYNAKQLAKNLTVAEAGLTNLSRIFVIETKPINFKRKISNNFSEFEPKDEGKREIIVTFNTTQGTKTQISINYDESIGMLLKRYLKRVDRPDLIEDKSNKICFLFNAIQLKLNDKTKVGDFFKNVQNPKVVVNDVINLIGA